MDDARIALVVGATQGFGRSPAAHLAATGVGVIGTYHRGANEAEELAEQVGTNGGQLSFLSLDVSRTEPVHRADPFGRSRRVRVRGRQGKAAGADRYQAAGLADRGIRVNTIMGGATESDIGNGIVHIDTVKEYATVIALGRIRTPDDLGVAVPVILSDTFDGRTAASLKSTAVKTSSGPGWPAAS